MYFDGPSISLNHFIMDKIINKIFDVMLVYISQCFFVLFMLCTSHRWLEVDLDTLNLDWFL